MVYIALIRVLCHQKVEVAGDLTKRYSKNSIHRFTVDKSGRLGNQRTKTTRAPRWSGFSSQGFFGTTNEHTKAMVMQLPWPRPSSPPASPPTSSPPMLHAPSRHRLSPHSSATQARNHTAAKRARSHVSGHLAGNRDLHRTRAAHLAVGRGLAPALHVQPHLTCSKAPTGRDMYPSTAQNLTKPNLGASRLHPVAWREDYGERPRGRRTESGREMETS